MMNASSVGDQPYVSVVVPFFDVVDCVTACIDSIMVQRYRNFEVVCVDDGSSDGTGEKLDTISARESKVRVVHIGHAGLSEARNSGVREARGELVTFVDGDDVVSPWYLESLVAAHAGVRGRFVRGQGVLIEDVRGDEIVWQKPSLAGSSYLGRDEALRHLLLGGTAGIACAAWACLADRNLYVLHPFEPGILYEDAYAMPSLLWASEEVVVIPEHIYGHVGREGSITHPAEMSVEHLLDRAHVVDAVIGLTYEWPWDLARLLPSWEATTYIGALKCARMMPFSGQRSDCEAAIRRALLQVLPEATAIWLREGVPLRTISARVAYMLPEAIWRAMMFVWHLPRELRNRGASRGRDKCSA